MKKCIYYGTTTFTTQDVAYKLQDILVDADIKNVEDGIEDIENYEMIYILTPTYGQGILEDHWQEVALELENKNLEGKFVAILGTGDSIVHADSFVNTMRAMHDILKNTNCTFVGNKVDVSGYIFDESTSIDNGYFIGLPIDEMNEYDKTEERIINWIEQIKGEIL